MNNRIFEDKSVFRHLVKYVTESPEHKFYNDREGAEESLRERIAGAKNGDPENCLVLGLLLIEIGEYGYALDLLRTVADGGMTDAQTVLGKVLTGDEAEKYTRMAADNGDSEAQFEFGNLMYDADELEKAAEYYQKSAEQGNVEARFNLGVVFMDLDKSEKAEEQFRIAAEQGYYRAQNNLGQLLVEKGETKEAEKYFRMALTCCGEEQDSSIAQYNLASLLDDNGNSAEAEKYYRLAADAGNTDAMFDLGSLLEDSGKIKEAEKYYRKAAKQGDCRAQNNLGFLLEDSGKIDEAEKYYRLSAEQEYVNAQYNLARLLNKAGKVDEAEKYYKLAAEQGDTDALNSLGSLFYESGKIEEAEKYLRMAAEQGNYHAQYCLGEMFRRAGNFEEAEKYYLMAGNSGSIIALGAMYEELGDADKAETYYLKEAERNNADAQYHLAKLYEKQGKSDEAKKYYYSAAKFGSDDAEDALKRLTANESDNTLSALFEDEDELERVINTIVIKMPDLVKKVGDIRSYINHLYDDANAGSADARCDLSYMLMCVDSDRYFEATEGLLLAAAEQGAAKAQYVLGYMYDSWGKTRRAQKYYRLAEEQNSADAQAAFAALLEKMKMKMNEYELAEQYRRLTAKQGHSDTRQNPEHADSAENQVSSEQVDYDALAERGTELLNTGNFDEAEKCLRPAAEQGNPQGVFMYGYLCMVRGNFDSARKYLSLAAEKGNIAAQNILKNLP